MIPSRTDQRIKRRVFIADDHPVVREGMAQTINRQPDMEICGEAADAAGVKAGIAKHKPDLLILDLMLRHDDGIELIKFLKAVFPSLAILVVSMHPETVFAERVIRAGALGYVMKLEAVDEMLFAARRVLDGKRYLSPPMIALLIEKGLFPLPEHGTALTDRELHIFLLYGVGLKSGEIGDRLNSAVKTIQTHREHIKEKMNLRNADEFEKGARDFLAELFRKDR